MASFCKKLAITLASCLTFILPFEALRNIDAQGLMLLLIGAAAWTADLWRPRQIVASLSPSAKVLVGAFIVACFISLLVNPKFGYDFLGAPYLRLGSAGLIACVGFGLLLIEIKVQQLVSWLYGLILAAAILSVPYSLLKFHTLHRVAGIFAQADIMAVFMGIGLLLGIHVIASHSKYKKYILVGQFLLAALLIMTETRAVLAATLLLLLLWQFQNQRQILYKWWPTYLVALLLIGFGVHLFSDGRLTSASYANDSLHYRLDLQKEALLASAKRPLWGYGAGNLADALDCRHISAPELKRSCHQGFFFNSSHNIFIDRALAIGWPGAVAYLALVMLAIYYGFKQTGADRILAYCILLIAIYYLTNITSVTLELLLWVFILCDLRFQKH